MDTMDGLQHLQRASNQISGLAEPEWLGDESIQQLGRYCFKRADTETEFAQVHRLNYETFVREIAQHDDPGSGRLVDKFHDKNTYLIATLGGEVVGMVAVHDRPPFSVAERLADSGVLDGAGERSLEVRLLAISPGY